MMKQIIFIFLILTGIFTFFSCEDLSLGENALDKPPSGDVTIDTIFSSSLYAERALSTAYTSLPYGVPYGWGASQDKLGIDLLESISDLCQSYLGWGVGAEMLYYNGLYNAGNAERYDTKYSYTKEESWQRIRAAYIFHENVHKVPNMTDDLKERRKGEALMIIAVHYTEMFRHFGGLPLVDKVIYPDDNFTYPRETVENTVNFIVDLCDRAAKDLPWTTTAEDDGRFTKAAALGLKIRVLLFAASPLFNDVEPYLAGEASVAKMTWYGDYQQSRWERVVKACEEFMTELNQGGNYKLVETGNYRQDFQDAWYKRANGEVLISTRVRHTCPDIWDGTFYFMQSSGWYGCSTPTLNYMDMFSMADGSPFPYDWDNIPAGVDPFENRDPRMYETLVINGDRFQGRAAETWIGGREQVTENATRARTGSVMRKFLLEHNYATLVGSVIHWPYLRLAEIYLSYAEALNETGKKEEAKQWFEKTRARVGVPAITKTLSKEEFREIILNERAIEFGYEEIRWFDLIRWKRNNDFTKSLYGLKIWKNSDNTYRYDKWEIPSRYWKSNWSPKWYLGAFPVAEINKGHGLIQNPGW